MSGEGASGFQACGRQNPRFFPTDVAVQQLDCLSENSRHSSRHGSKAEQFYELEHLLHCVSIGYYVGSTGEAPAGMQNTSAVVIHS